MGKILPYYKYSLIEEIKNAIVANTMHLYAFASNPIETLSVANVSNDDKSSSFDFIWPMLFGKKISNTDILPVINKNIWTSNIVYLMYDNTSNTLYSNNKFYVISEPSEVGGDYLIYKCIDNANGSYSTIDPGSIGTPTQASTFETSDGYKWRYITSISNVLYDKFATPEYIPVVSNANIVLQSQTNCGVEKVIITDGGSGYENFTEGTISSVINTTVIQLGSNASTENFKYNNCSIYMYNTELGTSQISPISSYISNNAGNFITLDEEANTSMITPGVTEYIVSPKVVFDTDGISPIAYSVVNSTSNSIHDIIILDIGSNISRANVSLSGIHGSGANLYCIIPPLGGHGNHPESELNIKGYSISFNFSNTESNTIISSNVIYNKIGLIKNPYTLNANNTKGSRYSSNTFNQLLIANIAPSHTFTVGETIVGSNSYARGIVVYSNTTQVYLVGDKHFNDEEYIGNTSTSNVTQIFINSIGNIYTKDIIPLYVQNIENITRTDSQSEYFKIILQV